LEVFGGVWREREGVYVETEGCRDGWRECIERRLRWKTQWVDRGWDGVVHGKKNGVKVESRKKNTK
jgi:hypothetical protein